MSEIGKYWKRATEGWLGIITYSILGILAALFIQSAGGWLLNTEFPIVTVSSDSMVPTMKVGDIVIVRGYEDYDAGDIIVFRGWRERPIIHRAVMIYDGENLERYQGFSEFDAKNLIEVHEGGQIFITKGDHNPICDQCGGHAIVTEGSVYGKSVLTIPKIGLIKVCGVSAKNMLLGSVPPGYSNGRDYFSKSCLNNL